MTDTLDLSNVQPNFQRIHEIIAALRAFDDAPDSWKAGTLVMDAARAGAFYPVKYSELRRFIERCGGMLPSQLPEQIVRLENRQNDTLFAAAVDAQRTGKSSESLAAWTEYSRSVIGEVATIIEEALHAGGGIGIDYTPPTSSDKREQNGNGNQESSGLKLPPEHDLRDLWTRLAEGQGSGNSDRKIAKEMQPAKGLGWLNTLKTRRTRGEISDWKKR